MKTAEQIVDEVIADAGTFQQLPEGLRVAFHACMVAVAGLALIQLADAAAELAMTSADADESGTGEYAEGRYDAAVEIAESILASVKEARDALTVIREKYGRGRVQ